jgi:hypothetical protein
MKHPPRGYRSPSDVREGKRLLRAVLSGGKIDRDKVGALMEKDPKTMTRPELVAAHTVFFCYDVVCRYFPADLSSVAYTSAWADALVEATGGTITRERVRHGHVVERTVRRHRGRGDIRRYRTAFVIGAGVDRRRSRERRPGTARRTSSSSITSGQDPSDPEPPSTGDGLHHVSIPLADELNRIAERLRARGGVG